MLSFYRKSIIVLVLFVPNHVTGMPTPGQPFVIGQLVRGSQPQPVVIAVAVHVIWLHPVTPPGHRPI